MWYSALSGPFPPRRFFLGRSLRDPALGSGLSPCLRCSAVRRTRHCPSTKQPTGLPPSRRVTPRGLDQAVSPALGAALLTCTRTATRQGTQKGTQSPRQITYPEGTHWTRINLDIDPLRRKMGLCPCLAGKGSAVRIRHAPPAFPE